MSDLQADIDTVSYCIKENPSFGMEEIGSWVRVADAARKVANPDYKAGLEAINEFTKNGWDATNNVYAIRLVVDAALGITEADR